ncbi:MAG: glutathione S-transferase [Gammaproteobacteria bacterium]|jgi:glutathione S-transferase|nr:glutathione S-transferase [Gammaproteobacteria bacterium]
MHLVLYGFRICPFVEKVNILLDEKNIHVERVYVDIRNKPDWFLKISPLGKVPILRVDDVLLFESTVINDFLDSLSAATSLYPTNTIQKHLNKSWIEWGSTLILATYDMTLAKDKESFLAKRLLVEQKLSILQEQVKNSPFFNGEHFSMIDLTYAPLFKRFDRLIYLYSIDLLANYPTLKQWSKNVLQRPSVHAGFIDNFDEELKILLDLKGSYLEEQNKTTQKFDRSI